MNREVVKRSLSLLVRQRVLLKFPRCGAKMPRRAKTRNGFTKGVIDLARHQ